MYISMALLQCIFIVVLQAAICYQNTQQANLLPEIDTSALLSKTTISDTIPMRAKDRLGRIKWENIAFMGFQVWFFGMAVDAVSVALTEVNIQGTHTQTSRLFIKTQLRSWFWLSLMVYAPSWVHSKLSMAISG